MEALEALEVLEIPKEIREHLEKYDLDACLACGTCSSGCPATGTEALNGWNTRMVIRLIQMGGIQEVVDSLFPWVCTGCGLCSYACPMGIDLAPILAHMKHLRPREDVAGILHTGVARVMESGNNMAIPRDDYLETLADVGADLADEDCPGFYVPVDRQGADILFFPNSKEVFGDFEDMKWWWKVFYAARENWTVPSENWESVDWGLFTGNYEATRTLAQRKIDHMKRLKLGRMIMPDCGGGSYGCRTGMRICAQDDPGNSADFIYLYDYLKEILEQGRIRVDKERNKGRIFTWHDSCKHGRELERHFGKAYYEEARWILKQCVGEEQFVDMVPNSAGSYCCGGGGGNWPGPYEKESAYHSRRKYDQIMRTGADVVVVGCSNCRDQIMKRMPKYYDCHYEVKYLWQLVAESLVLEPLSPEEAARSEAEGQAQWMRFGLDLSTEY